MGALWPGAALRGAGGRFVVGWCERLVLVVVEIDRPSRPAATAEVGMQGLFG